ncbi:MAG: VIT1/CCC1 transporter family protein [Alphaproteobacteria bacterium]|nr:VIT1/CCC1 transporter family protein [Alphaproteobacteria bacterium]
MSQTPNFNRTGALVLGMHDAIVSLTGLIIGLAFTSVSRIEIVLTCIIASVTASLSMGASNYLAHRAERNPNALRTAIYTGAAYFTTCLLLILPFIFIYNRLFATLSTFIMAVLIITFFNIWASKLNHTKFLPRFIEMLFVCVGISIIAFFIGQFAQYFLGVHI